MRTSDELGVKTRPEAPGGFESLACNSVCAFDTANDTWTCDTNVVCGAMNNGADATAVHNFAGTGADYSAWGQCRSNGSFCCAHTEQQAPDKVYHVELLGTPEWDILSFHHAATASNLRPARSHDLTGSIFGNENGIEIIGELITGSNYAGDDYRDFLYGEGGEDTINGMADGDWIEGGDHDDTISGGTGADVIYGGDGNDTCAGDAGNDKLEGDDGDEGRNFTSKQFTHQLPAFEMIGVINEDFSWQSRYGFCHSVVLHYFLR